MNYTDAKQTIDFYRIFWLRNLITVQIAIVKQV